MIDDQQHRLQRHADGQIGEQSEKEELRSKVPIEDVNLLGDDAVTAHEGGQLRQQPTKTGHRVFAGQCFQWQSTKSKIITGRQLPVVFLVAPS